MTRQEFRSLDDSTRALRHLSRSNLYAFLQSAFAVIRPSESLVPAPYLEAMCVLLQEVAEGRETRVMISVAPRHLKSILASVVLPAFVLGRDPTASIMVVSYGSELVREHVVLFRTLVRSAFYRALFPDTRFDPDADRLDEIRTTQGGGRRAVTLGGAITGLGASLIILDDLIKAGDVQHPAARDDARTKFDQTIYTRLNDKRQGAIVSVAQRLHPDDLPAYLIEKGFTHMKLDSIAQTEARWPLYNGRVYHRQVGDILNPAREDEATLDRIRAEIGHRTFSAQYLQDPQPGESAFLKLADLALVDAMPPLDTFPRRIQSWDLALNDGPRSDYSVGLTFGWHALTRCWYLLDVMRGRFGYPTLKDRVTAARLHWNAERVLIEATALGEPLLQELGRSVRRTYVSISPKDSKVERFVAQTDWICEGRLRFPSSAPWFDAFRRELLNFPNDRHDDQVDALTQFVAYIRVRELAFLDTDPETGRRNGTIGLPTVRVRLLG